MKGAGHRWFTDEDDGAYRKSEMSTGEATLPTIQVEHIQHLQRADRDTRNHSRPLYNFQPDTPPAWAWNQPNAGCWFVEGNQRTWKTLVNVRRTCTQKHLSTCEATTKPLCSRL